MRILPFNKVHRFEYVTMFTMDSLFIPLLVFCNVSIVVLGENLVFALKLNDCQVVKERQFDEALMNEATPYA